MSAHTYEQGLIHLYLVYQAASLSIKSGEGKFLPLSMQRIFLSSTLTNSASTNDLSEYLKKCLSGTSLVGVVHTLPNKYAGGIFMRGSEWRRV